MCVCVCVFERMERENGREGGIESAHYMRGVYICPADISSSWEFLPYRGATGREKKGGRGLHRGAGWGGGGQVLMRSALDWLAAVSCDAAQRWPGKVFGADPCF